ncbi:alpha/beta hydrolase, partial [Bifidobacterium adolescentis]
MTIELNNNIYTDGGNDTETTPVVLVHGFPVDHRMWDECAAALRDQAVKQGVKPFAIWAPDMPGAGEGPIPSDEDSGGKDADGAFPYGLDRMADAYVDLLHAAGYGKAIWVGLSMGGYLILDIQRLHPEAVAALALCDTQAAAD